MPGLAPLRSALRLPLIVAGVIPVFWIELDAEREAILAGLGAAELKDLQARLLRERRWG
jgi:hypothetical protein